MNTARYNKCLETSEIADSMQSFPTMIALQLHYIPQESGISIYNVLECTIKTYGHFHVATMVCSSYPRSSCAYHYTAPSKYN